MKNLLFFIILFAVISCTPKDELLYEPEETAEEISEADSSNQENYNWREEQADGSIAWVVVGANNKGLSEEGINHIISWNGYSIESGDALREVDYVKLKKDKLVLSEWVSGSDVNILTFYAVLPNGRITDYKTFTGDFEAMDDGLYSVNLENQSISFRVGSWEKDEKTNSSGLVTELKTITLDDSMMFEESE